MAATRSIASRGLAEQDALTTKENLKEDPGGEVLAWRVTRDTWHASPPLKRPYPAERTG